MKTNSFSRWTRIAIVVLALSCSRNALPNLEIITQSNYESPKNQENKTNRKEENRYLIIKLYDNHFDIYRLIDTKADTTLAELRITQNHDASSEEGPYFVFLNGKELQPDDPLRENFKPPFEEYAEWALTHYLNGHLKNPTTTEQNPK